MRMQRLHYVSLITAILRCELLLTYSHSVWYCCILRVDHSSRCGLAWIVFSVSCTYDLSRNGSMSCFLLLPASCLPSLWAHTVSLFVEELRSTLVSYFLLIPSYRSKRLLCFIVWIPPMLPLTSDEPLVQVQFASSYKGLLSVQFISPESEPFQFKFSFTATAADTITIVPTSTNANDALLNSVKLNVSLGSGF